MMKYLVLGDDHKTLFIEADEQLFSVYFSKEKGEWLTGGTRLFDARVGFDPYKNQRSYHREDNSKRQKRKDTCFSRINAEGTRNYS